MHGRKLVKEFRMHELHTRLKQFGAYHHRQTAGKEEHDQRKPQIQRADILMVGCFYPAHQTTGVMIMTVVVSVLCRIHIESPLLARLIIYAVL